MPVPALAAVEAAELAAALVAAELDAALCARALPHQLANDMLRVAAQIRVPRTSLIGKASLVDHPEESYVETNSESKSEFRLEVVVQSFDTHRTVKTLKTRVFREHLVFVNYVKYGVSLFSPICLQRANPATRSNEAGS
jgi:hypothetical protein